MADQHDSSGSSGQQPESEKGPSADGGTTLECKFHAYSGTEPCPYCIEAGNEVRISTALAFDQSTKSFRRPDKIEWIDDCPNCASTDLRVYEPNNEHPTGYIWCGQCGAKSP